MIELERRLWEAAARAIEPRIPVRPSTWARATLRLTSEQAARPGPYDPDWKPWLRDLLDLCFLEPGKKGMIGMKPAQIGWSVAMTALMVWAAQFEPGPFLYISDQHEKAKKFCEVYFEPFSASSPELRKLFDVGAERTEQRFHKPFAGGYVDFFGAGTEGSMTSWARRWIVLDEYVLASENYRKTGGDLFIAANKRIETFKDFSRLMAFGHPRYEGQDLDAMMKSRSDRRRWVFDCPRCGAAVAPRWELVEFEKVSDAGEPRPDSARLLCPHCRQAISDAERARATWPARLGTGGTGRLESELPPEEAATREYIGVSINKLADPHTTVRELALEFCTCHTEESLRDFYNLTMGEPRTETKAVLTADTVRGAIEVRDRVLLPGGDLGVRFIAVGTDVQMPRANPTLYVAGVAYAATGMAFVTLLERVSGWAAYFELLRRHAAEVEGRGPAGVSLATIDAGWETGQVIEQQRGRSDYAAADSRLIRLLPVRYVPHLHADNPAQLAPERKRQHPTRPELGLIDYYWLHRHSWVDRVMRRYLEGRIRILCRVPEGFEAHCLANRLMPAPKRHGMEQDRLEYVKPDEYRDDWFQALVYAEAGAALALGLDTIHAYATRPEEPATAAVEEVGGGFGESRFGHGRFN